MLESMVRMIQQAGSAGVLLTLTGIALWSTVFLRLLTLRPAYRGCQSKFVRQIISQPASATQAPLSVFVQRLAARLEQPIEQTEVEALVNQAKESLSQGRRILAVLVVVAPLLGLLGTVNGMVELFESLGQRSSITGSDQASIAGGISTALITTQLGLVTGASGLLASRFLDRRDRRLASELTELRDIVINHFTVPSMKEGLK